MEVFNNINLKKGKNTEKKKLKKQQKKYGPI